jgi:hypothetical protein
MREVGLGEGRRWLVGGTLLAGGGYGVVPVVSRWAQALDCGVLCDHSAAGCLAGIVGVEAAVDVVTVSDEWIEPRGIGASAGCRDADATGMDLVATDGVNRRFAEDDLVGSRNANPEVARIPAAAGCQSTPYWPIRTDFDSSAEV